ncbi:MAG: late competence development ComFB family protein [Spirochaetales bacterium]|jgi:competence protein ComFB|nr:late competence development ComFB family protein [Spirochaetales bacterium]
MTVHNQMEDLVINLVNEIFDEEKATKQGSYCICKQCRTDVSCYVLNRIEPRYVISERGLAHTESAYLERIQETADLVTLIREGIEQVSATKRPFFAHSEDCDHRQDHGSMFNFPIIKGRVLNGNTFEPIVNVDVFLKCDSAMLEMVDPNWRNPCHLYDSGTGSFFFLPAPVSATSLGEKRAFQFEILVDDHRFEPLHHFFTLDTVSNEGFRDALHTNESHSAENLYLFPIT